MEIPEFSWARLGIGFRVYLDFQTLTSSLFVGEKRIQKNNHINLFDQTIFFLFPLFFPLTSPGQFPDECGVLGPAASGGSTLCCPRHARHHGREECPHVHIRCGKLLQVCEINWPKPVRDTQNMWPVQIESMAIWILANVGLVSSWNIWVFML